MELTTRNPYWLVKNGYMYSYPSLQENIKTDVAVVGGGITGALVTYQLLQAGYDVVVVDRRNIGMGSTSASTALLQYEIDTPLHKLVGMVGEKNAIESYRGCSRAIEEIEEIVRKEKYDVNFEKRPSLQYASYRKDVRQLKKEMEIREKAHFNVELWDEHEVRKHFGINAPAALYSKQAAQIDPFRLAHSIFQSKCDHLRVFDKNEVTEIRNGKAGVTLLLDTGKKVTARHLVIAAGYESQKYIPFKVVDIQTTYAIISEPLEKKQIWYENALIWETKNPYLYIRTTSDSRIMVGGRDNDVTDSRKRHRHLVRKAECLAQDFHRLMPDVFFRTDFSWAGAFGSTKDGLPYIGTIRQMPHTYFALGFGGNGITFSQLAGEIISAALKNKKHPLRDVFAFDR